MIDWWPERVPVAAGRPDAAPQSRYITPHHATETPLAVTEHRFPIGVKLALVRLSFITSYFEMKKSAATVEKKKRIDFSSILL